VFVILIAGAIAIGLAAVALAGAGERVPARSATSILTERLAAGEIDEPEYRERLHRLEVDAEEHGDRTGRSPKVVAVVVGLTLLAVLVLSMGRGSDWWNGMGPGHMGASGDSGTSADPVAGASEIEMVAGDLWFEPEKIEVSARETVNLAVTNEGRIFHDLTVPGLDLAIGVEPGDTVRGALRAPEPGEYEFLCTVPGHASAGMTGTIVVVR